MNVIKIKKTDLFFFTALIIFLSYQMLSASLFNGLLDFSIAKYVCFFIVSGLLLYKFVLDSSYKNILIYVVILLVFVLVGLHAQNIRDLILIGLFILEARNVKFDSILKTYAWVLSIGLSIIILLYFIGFFNSVDYKVLLTGLRIGTKKIRHSLGFGWVTYAPNFFMTVAICCIYLTRSQRKVAKTYIILTIVNILLYYFTDTNVVFFELLLLLVLAVVARSLRIDLTKKTMIKVILSLTFIICAAFSLWISFNYSSSNPWMRKIDVATNYRLTLTKRALDLYSIKLFGNPIKWITVSTTDKQINYVDSSYVQLLVQYGVFVFGIVLILSTTDMIYTIKKGDTVGILCLIIIAIHSITDPQLFNLAYNPFLLEIGYILLSESSGYGGNRKKGSVPNEYKYIYEKKSCN